MARSTFHRAGTTGPAVAFNSNETDPNHSPVSVVYHVCVWELSVGGAWGENLGDMMGGGSGNRPSLRGMAFRVTLTLG